MTYATPTQIIHNTLSFEGEKLTKTSKWGIERETLQRFNKKYKKAWKLSALQHWQAVEVLKCLYWDEKLELLHPNVAQLTFDWAINSNSDNAYATMHKAFGLKEQKMLSMELVDTINSMPYRLAMDIINTARIKYLKSLNTFKMYGKGWVIRIRALEEVDFWTKK